MYYKNSIPKLLLMYRSFCGNGDEELLKDDDTEPFLKNVYNFIKIDI